MALFAGDIVHFVIGDKWELAIGLLQAFGLIAAAEPDRLQLGRLPAGGG